MNTLSIKWLWQKPMGIVMTGAILSSIGYTLWVLFNLYNPPAEQIVSSLLLILFGLLGCCFAFYLYSRKSVEPRFRRGWILISLALFFNFIAEILSFYFDTILGIHTFPTLADVFYLPYYPLILAGILFFSIISVRRGERFTLIVDLSIVLVSCAVVFWFFFLVPIASGSEIDQNNVIAISYPIGDFLLLVGVLALLQKDLEKVAQQTLIFLAVGMFFTALPDMLFAYFEAYRLPYQTAYLNILWVAASLFMMLAPAWQIHKGQPVHVSSPLFINRYQIMMRQSLPYMAAAIAPLLILLTINSSTLVNRRLFGLLIGTFALIILIIIRQYVVLIENVHLYEELQKLAITDGLTKIFNRHYFNLTLQREIERTKRYNKSLCLLMMDVDEFKFFNDHYGHLHGDIVLKMIAQALSKNLRKTDILARFGGDEFVAILTETNLEGARSVAHKIQTVISSLVFLEHNLSISVGSAIYRAGMTPEQFIETADRDLYQHKNLPSSKPS